MLECSDQLPRVRLEIVSSGQFRNTPAADPSFLRAALRPADLAKTTESIGRSLTGPRVARATHRARDLVSGARERLRLETSTPRMDDWLAEQCFVFP